MYPLQGTPGEHEQPAPEPERTPQEVFLVWFIRASAIVYLTAATYEVLRNDEIRLQLMHTMIRTLQTTARLLGMWALKTEKRYNAYVDTLH